MKLPEFDQLRIDQLSRLFDYKTESYKLFWFQALLESIAKDEQSVTFDELVNRMICNAWYMVSEYRLSLGRKDALEALVHDFSEKSGLPSNAKREAILLALRTSKDENLQAFKLTLIQYVPYRLQSPFLSMTQAQWAKGIKRITSAINQHDGLLYRFASLGGLQSRIQIDPLWAFYLRKNLPIIEGWLKFNFISYLQRRNPSVPGIANKLEPPQSRKLGLVTSFWKSVIAAKPIREIYGGLPLSDERISIDHFIPWSYVTHDELWNLSPTTRSINSSKSNRLPDWNTYFNRLCTIKYSAYEAIWEFESVHKAFEKCSAEHSNDTDIHHKLYRPNLRREEFYANLESVVHPIYTAAENMGFPQWQLK